MTPNINKDVSFLNKDFVSFRNALINFSKVYFPNTYKDFSDSSLGAMFIEMTAYVGDVLSYYLDSNIKESMILYAEEYKNLLNLAQSMGYKPKSSYPSTTKINVYQQLPSTGINGESIDFKYALRINEMTVKSTGGVQFRILEPIDFSNQLSQDFSYSVYSTDNSGRPLIYLIKKTVPVVAGTINTIQAEFTSVESFATFTIPYDDVIEILDVYDNSNTSNNRWHEVDFLAQNVILNSKINSEYTNPQFTSESQAQSPFILSLKTVDKRFVIKKTEEGYTQLQFGSGTSGTSTSIPNSQTIAEFVKNYSFTDVANNFLHTKTYGVAPSAGMTLTIRYTRGGGIDSNVPQNDINSIGSFVLSKTADDYTDLNEKSLFNQIVSTLAVINDEPATGGRGSESLEELRQNAISYFAAQDRCVTEPDYISRILSMPSKYGTVSKAYIKKSSENFAMDLYVLGYDNLKHLTNLGDIAKNNLKNYLSFYKDLTSTINIKNAYIVNIGIDFDIITNPKYNRSEVVLRCIDEIKKYFLIDNWQIGQPIILSEIYNFLDNVEGVRTVSNVSIYNKYSSLGDTTYSNNFYGVSAATIDGIIYPSMDPMCWEVKYPNDDIRGIAR